MDPGAAGTRRSFPCSGIARTAHRRTRRVEPGVEMKALKPSSVKLKQIGDGQSGFQKLLDPSPDFRALFFYREIDCTKMANSAKL